MSAASERAAKLAAVMAGIVDQIRREGPRTASELGAGGTDARRRALEALRDEGAVIEVGRRGSAIVYGLGLQL